VALTHVDLRRLVQSVAQPPEALLDWLAPDAVEPDAETSSFVSLPGGPRLMVLAHGARGCKLLGADDRCTAYAARPKDCQLYPFVLERDERRAPVRLALFEPEGCGDRAPAPISLASLERADAERWSEIEAYRALVARWNRLAGHRRRFGHRAANAREFVTFLLDLGAGAA
jgi:Fe-S-cluster containining protein